MTPSLNVDEETKDRLEELQAQIRLRTGREVTQTELLRQIVDRGYESREEIIDSFNESTVPLSEDEKAAMHAAGSAPATKRPRPMSTTFSTTDSL
jgi:hypothetical protein